jgi:hypothetical protein
MQGRQNPAGACGMCVALKQTAKRLRLLDMDSQQPGKHDGKKTAAEERVCSTS